MRPSLQNTVVASPAPTVTEGSAIDALHRQLCRLPSPYGDQLARALINTITAEIYEARADAAGELMLGSASPAAIRALDAGLSLLSTPRQP